MNNMRRVKSNVEIFIDGIRITDDFKIKEGVHKDYINSIECIKYAEEKLKVTAEIESEDMNKNYLIFLDLKEFLIRLFVLFGVNVKIDELKTNIDTDYDFKRLTHVISPPNLLLESNDILEYERLVKDSLYSDKRNGEFYNLIESNQEVDMVHRFRSLFATFDKIAPKQCSNDNIVDYDAIKQRYVEIINSLYTDCRFTRYHEIVKELISVNLIDERAGKNYSNKLEEEFGNLEKGTIINEDVSFNLLKCIQILRNKINHGSFNGLTPKSVSASYELLLPLTKELMRNALKDE